METENQKVSKWKQLSTFQQALVFGGIVLVISLATVLLTGGSLTDTITTSNTPHQSQWDKSVDVVVAYLKSGYLRDPGSYESISWGSVKKNSDGTWQVTHSYRAKNGFGGMGSDTKTFIISSDGQTVVGVR